MLAVRAGQGDASAEHELVRHNLALVVTIARMQRRGTAPLDDLVQEGNIGLMRAVAKFDPHAGTRFSTYAVWWIRAYVGRCVKTACSTVAPRTGAFARPDFSLDAAIGESTDVTHLELLEDDGAGPEACYLAAESDHRVRTALATVRERVGELGWDILHDRLQEDSPTTLAELGRRWGVSRERVRQVEVKTKRFLKAHLDPVRREAA